MISQELIQLYCFNLNALSVSGALVSGMAYTGIVVVPYAETGYAVHVTTDDQGNTRQDYASPYTANEVIYFFCVTLCLMTGIFMVSQATIVSIFAATKALKGDSSDVVLEVVKHIQTQQTFIFQLGIVAITSLFGHCIAMSWARSALPIAVIVTVIYLVGFAYLTRVTYDFYWAFHPVQTDTYDARPGNVNDDFRDLFI